MTATLAFNVDLGNYSDRFGAAQRLSNGNYVFTSGAQGNPPNLFGQSIEVRPDGTPVYVLQASQAEFRTLRVRTLYEGTNLPLDEDKKMPHAGIPRRNDSPSSFWDIGVVLATPMAASAESLASWSDILPSVQARAANVPETAARLDQLFSADTASTTPVITARYAQDAVPVELEDPLKDTRW
jgi:hypothetical protein